MISLDFESTGLDLFHAARPFAVVWCDGGAPECREWDVDPLTRKVQVPDSVLQELRGLVRTSDRIVFHNSKFDGRCLEVLGVEPPWEKFEDTLIAAHVLYSAPRHNLTHLTREYLGEDMTPWEKTLQKAVLKCRSMVSQARLKEKRGKVQVDDLLPIRHWKITEEGDPDIPSAKGQDGLWHSDYWLPRAMFRHDPESVSPEFETVLRDYALVDAVTTYRLWERLEALLRERGLWRVYRSKLESVPAAYRMERRGMTVDAAVLRRKQAEYTEEVGYLSEVLVGVADSLGYALELPDGNTNHNLDDFVFGRAVRVPREGKKPERMSKLPRLPAPDTLNLPVVALTDSGAPSFGSDARDIWLADLGPGTKARLFVETFARWSELGKGLSYLDGYERFLLPVGDGDGRKEDDNRAKILVQGEQDRNVLGVDGKSNTGSLRSTHCGRGKEGPSSLLRNPLREDTGREDYNAHLRQPEVCQPGPSEIGNAQGQQRGHGKKGEAGVGGQECVSQVSGELKERKPTPERTGNGRGSTEDQRGTRVGSEKLQPVGEGTRSWEVNRLLHCDPKNLETRQVNTVQVIHPSFNIVGTQTTRWSCQNPNAQNISQQSAVNLRECFGPGPGREWYSFDAAGIELIIPASLADEREILDVMLNPDRPPYFGSYHLLIFSILHPDLWAAHGVECKSLFAGAEYTDTKSFTFGRQYGAQKKKADATAGVRGASDMVGQRFPNIEKLSREVINRANATGRVFTVPDRSVDPERGYPIVCRRNEYDRISPTIPFAYFVSGTAGWWMNRAVVKCDALMETWRREEGYDGHLIATVHDEIVVDLPAGVDNRNKVFALRDAMQSCGTDLDIPTPVSCERHPVSWAVGEKVK